MSSCVSRTARTASYEIRISIDGMRSGQSAMITAMYKAAADSGTYTVSFKAKGYVSSGQICSNEPSAEAEADTTVPVCEYQPEISTDIDTSGECHVYSDESLPDRFDYSVSNPGDADYYLSRAVNGTWNKVGTPFMDFRNSGDFSDRLTVIYGHYMGDGSMFTDIHNYKSQKYYDEHPYIDFYTPNGSFQILPVAGVYQNVEYWDFTFDYDSDETFLQQIDNWEAVSTFKSDTEYDADDCFVVLTLCTYYVENSRFLLVGKIAEPDEFVN